jgi:hypothetical protein
LPTRPQAHKAYAPTSPHRPRVSSDAIKNKSLTPRLHRRQAFIKIFKEDIDIDLIVGCLGGRSGMLAHIV